MKRYIMVAAAAVAALALVGGGVFVGSQLGDEETVVVSADAQGPLSEKDALILSTFSQASTEFEKTLQRARKGKQVGDKLTTLAVVVLNVGRQAEAPAFKEAVDEAGQAMLLLGAGVTADDGATVQEGLDLYASAQEKFFALAEEVKRVGGQDSPSESPAPAEEDGESNGDGDPGGE